MNALAKKTGLVRAAVACLALTAVSCPTPAPYVENFPLGNPPGFDVYVLTGDTLQTKNVAINGLQVDSSSPAAVTASVNEPIAPREALSVVAETTGAPELSIDFTAAGKPVPPYFYGCGIQWKSRDFLTDPVYRELVRSIHIDIARFPAGQERVRYDRDAQPTPNDELGRDRPYEYALTGQDVANYIAFCRDLGIEAEPEINLYIDDPERNASMIDQIVNGLGYDLKHISAGNEPDVSGYFKYYGASDKAGVFAEYAARLEDYVARINAIHPGITYVLPELAIWGPPDLGDNLTLLLGYVDPTLKAGISAHWYMLGGGSGEPSYPWYPSLEHLSTMWGNYYWNISYLSDIYAQMCAQADAWQRGAPLFIGEMGPGGNGRHCIEDRLCTAIFNAEVQEYCKTRGFDSIQWFGLSDPLSFYPWVPSLIGVGEGYFELRPQYYMHLIYKHLWGTQSSASPMGRTSAVSVYAAKGGGFNYLMLINRTERSVVNKTVRVTTATGMDLVNEHPRIALPSPVFLILPIFVFLLPHSCPLVV